MASFDSGEVCERSWTFYLKRPCQQIPNKQLRTSQGQQTRPFQEHLRTSSRKDTERNNKAM